jgi:hypothetical protein
MLCDIACSAPLPLEAYTRQSPVFLLRLNSSTRPPHGPRFLPWTVIIFLITLLLAACKHGSTVSDEYVLPEGDISLDSPFADAEDFKCIHPGFAKSDTTGAPWGFAHKGLDLILARSGARAVAPSDRVT